MGSHPSPAPIMAKEPIHPKDQQVGLQRLWLGVGGANLLLFYFIPAPVDDALLNLVVGIWYWFLYFMIGRWPVTVILYCAMLSGLGVLTYVSAQTGGINSPKMVWFTLLPVAVLTVQGARKGSIWLLITLAVGMALYIGVQEGWISGAVDQHRSSIGWSFALLVSVMLTQQVVVNIYGHVNQQQILELENRNADLEKAQTALIQAQSHKDEFIASMGHELRTPMNAILGLNGVLQKELADRNEDLQLAELIRTSTEQLLKLINDILLLSQLEANRVSLRKEVVAMDECMQILSNRWIPLAQSKGLVLDIACDDNVPPWMKLDPVRFEQILDQLLDNALKFTPQGYVSVRVSATHGLMRVDVQDTGPGIRKDKLTTIFDRFEQADVHTNRTHGGTGIGLAICSRLVALLGGQLQVQSETGRGAHFWFEWPMERAMPPKVVDLSAMQEPVTPHFLVVDDNAVNRKLTLKALMALWPNAHVAVASGGEEALSWLDQHEVDLVLLDRVMPQIDGLETARRIRAHTKPQVARVAILGLTAYEDDEDNAQCVTAGMDDVATKPITPEALKKKILTVLHLSQTQRPTPTGGAA